MKHLIFALLIILASAANAQKDNINHFPPQDLDLYANWTAVPGMDAVILFNPCPDLTSKASLGPITPPQDKTQDDPKAGEIVRPQFVWISYAVNKSWGRQKIGSAVVKVEFPSDTFLDGSYLLRVLVTHLLRSGEVKDLDRPQKSSVTVLGWKWVEEDFFYSTEQDGWLEY